MAKTKGKTKTTAAAAGVPASGSGSVAYERKKRRLLKQGLVGFALMKALDPEAFQAISKKAGRKAQRLFGDKVRWSKAKARKLAGAGGKACQKKYRKEGHPLVLRKLARIAAEQEATS